MSLTIIVRRSAVWEIAEALPTYELEDPGEGDDVIDWNVVHDKAANGNSNRVG